MRIRPRYRSCLAALAACIGAARVASAGPIDFLGILTAYNPGRNTATLAVVDDAFGYSNIDLGGTYKFREMNRVAVIVDGEQTTRSAGLRIGRLFYVDQDKKTFLAESRYDGLTFGHVRAWNPSDRTLVVFGQSAATNNRHAITIKLEPGTFDVCVDGQRRDDLPADCRLAYISIVPPRPQRVLAYSSPVPVPPTIPARTAVLARVIAGTEGVMLAPPRGDTPPVPFQLRRTDTFLLNGRPASRQAAMAPGHHVLVTEIHHTHKRRQLAGRTEIPGRVEGRLAGNNEQGLTLLSPDADRKTRRLVTVDPDARIEIDGVEAPLQALTNGLRVAVFPAAPRTLYLDLNPLASASIEELREAMKGLNWSRAHAAAKTLLGHAWEKPEAYVETICATLEDPRSRRCRPALLDGLWSLPEAVRDAQAKRVLDSAVNTLRTSGYGMRDSVAIIERYADKLDPEQRSSMTALLDSGFARPHREWVKRLRAALTPKQNDQAAP